MSDFGLSRFTGSSSNLSTLGKLRGTYAYSAPEVCVVPKEVLSVIVLLQVYFGDPFTTKADCYSVGIIFWEIAQRALTGEYAMPYSEYQELVFDFQIIIQVAKNQRRPTISPLCPPDYRDLITSCWSQTAGFALFGCFDVVCVLFVCSSFDCFIMCVSFDCFILCVPLLMCFIFCVFLFWSPCFSFRLCLQLRVRKFPRCWRVWRP